MSFGQGDNFLPDGCEGLGKISAGLAPTLLMFTIKTDTNTMTDKPAHRRRLLFKSETLDAPSVGVAQMTSQGF